MCILLLTLTFNDATFWLSVFFITLDLLIEQPDHNIILISFVT